jgi:hypothetical protein
MNGEIQILAVELDGYDGLIATFSEGQLADTWSRSYWNSGQFENEWKSRRLKMPLN